MPSAKSKSKSTATELTDKENADVTPRAGAIQLRGGTRAAANAVESTVPFLEIPRDEEDWRFASSFAPVGQEVGWRRAARRRTARPSSRASSRRTGSRSRATRWSAASRGCQRGSGRAGSLKVKLS